MATDGKPKDFRAIIRHFTPAWFAVIMGTGAISLLLNGFPYGNERQIVTILTLAFFFLNLVLFCLFTAITIARYALFPDVWSIMLYHPVQSLYIGCFPMGAATLINVAATMINVRCGFGGRPFLLALWGCWWLDVTASLLCCWGMAHIMSTKQSHSLERMTAVWLLPVVTLIVASSTGGILGHALLDQPSLALITITMSTLMVMIGLSLALMLLTVYLMRLIVHGLPSGATIISVFLPLGPTGQAGYAFLLIGRCFRELLPLKSAPPDHFLGSDVTGDVINVVCVCIAFALWALASMWLVFALLGVQEVIRRTRIPFKLPFWGLIFPNGVYANLTVALSSTLDSKVFRIYGAIYSVLTIALWIGVTSRTVVLVKSAQIFEAPCLEDIDMARFEVKESPVLPDASHVHATGQIPEGNTSAAFRHQHAVETTRNRLHEPHVHGQT